MSWVITYTTDELHFLTWTMYFSLSYCTSDSYCSCRHLQPRYPRYNDECPIFNPYHTVYPLCLWWTEERLDYTHTQLVSLISGLQRF